MSNITLSEWKARLKDVAAKVSALAPTLNVEVDRCTLRIKTDALSLRLEPDFHGDWGPPEVSVGSSSALPVNITLARATHSVIGRALEAGEYAFLLVGSVRVWIANCPCDSCSGRGRQMYSDAPCDRCGGTGKRE